MIAVGLHNQLALGAGHLAEEASQGRLGAGMEAPPVVAGGIVVDGIFTELSSTILLPWWIPQRRSPAMPWVDRLR